MGDSGATFDERFGGMNPPSPDPRAALRNAMVPPPPPAAPKPPNPRDEKIAEDERRGEEHIRKAEEAFEREAHEYETRQADLEPRRRALMAELDRPLPARPHLREAPPAPQVDTDGAQTWIMASMLLGSLAGALTRNHVTNALAAMQGSLDGYAAGKQQQFSNNMKIWEAENKRAIEASENALTAYREILEDRKMNIEQKSVMLQIAAQEHQDQAMATAARGKNELVIAQLYDKQAQAQQQMKDHETALSEKAAQEAETHRHNLATEAAAMTRAQNTGRGGTQLLDEDAIDMRARLALEGNPLAFRGMRAGSPDYAAVSNRFAQLAQQAGMSPAEITRRQTEFTGQQAYSRTSGTMGARVEMASNEVVQLAPQAIEATRAVPRGDLTPINKLFQEGLDAHIPLLSQNMQLFLGSRQTSDPAYNDAAVALWSLATAYGRAMNPQGVPRVSERFATEQMGLFALANSQPALEAQIYRVLKEVQNSKIAVARTRGPEQDPGIVEIQRIIDQLGLKPGAAYKPGAFPGWTGTTTAPRERAPSEAPGPARPLSTGKGDRLSSLPEGWSSEQVA